MDFMDIHLDINGFLNVIEETIPHHNSIIFLAIFYENFQYKHHVLRVKFKKKMLTIFILYTDVKFVSDNAYHH